MSRPKAKQSQAISKKARHFLTKLILLLNIFFVKKVDPLGHYSRPPAGEY